MKAKLILILILFSGCSQQLTMKPVEKPKPQSRFTELFNKADSVFSVEYANEIERLKKFEK